MQVKTDDAGECVSLGNIDRHVGRKAVQDRQDARDAVAQQQDLFGAKAAAFRMRLGEHSKHNGPLCDEAVFTPGQIALSDVAEFRDARIVGIRDGNRGSGHGGLNCP
ncbi:hypothetical protein RHECNPAF_3500067 [Rhizobium etli CNPAF512]|nr:hypothetical protein RHECNPAF_3500067 [Rhizobium etli CNPAF512]